MTIQLSNQCTIGTKLYPFDKLHSVAEEVEKVRAVNEDDKNCLRDALKEIKKAILTRITATFFDTLGV